MLLTVLVLLASPAPDLGHPDYEVREVETARARALGPFAVPHLLAAEAGECPEARARAAVLMVPYRTAAGDRAELRRWVEGPEPTESDYSRLHALPPDRHRLALALRRAGLLDADDSRHLEAGLAPTWWCVMWGQSAWHDYTAAAVRRARVRHQDRTGAR